MDYFEFKELLREAITNNLTIEIDKERSFDYNHHEVIINVKFDGQIIASDYFNIYNQ